MVQLMFAYGFAVLMILTQYFMARRNRRQGWTKRRVSLATSRVSQEVSPMKMDQAEEDRPFRHLAELEALNRALIAYHVPQKPEVTVETTATPEAETEKIAVRRKSPSRGAHNENARF
jgi:hypothetical protein